MPVGQRCQARRQSFQPKQILTEPLPSAPPQAAEIGVTAAGNAFLVDNCPLSASLGIAPDPESSRLALLLNSSNAAFPVRNGQDTLRGSNESIGQEPRT